MTNFALTKEGIQMIPCIFSSRRGNSLYPFLSPSLETQPVAMLSALKFFCAKRHKFPSPPLMGISLFPSHGVKCCPCDWCWTKLGWRGCPCPLAGQLLYPFPGEGEKSRLSSWIFLTCHPRGGNPTLVAWRGHGQPSAGRAALLCQTILNTGDHDRSGRRRHPHCSLHHLLLEDVGKQGGASGVELERMWAQWIWGIGGCAGDITVAAKVGVILIDVLAPKQTLDIAALVTPGRQLLFGTGMRRAAGDPLQSPSAPSWCPRVGSAAKNLRIVLGWGGIYLVASK